VSALEIYVKLDEILDKRGMTRKKLAELTGLRPNVISELCNNQRTTVNREHIGRIAEVLGIENIEELIQLHKK
jgi:transcriptional regulator with XRE-family HTH domain